MLTRLRAIGITVASLAALRVELFGLELREQLDQWLRVALLALAGIVLGCVGLGFLAVLVSVAFWDSHRLAVLGIFTLAFLAGAAWCVRRLSIALAGAPEAFSETVAEFRRDARRLSGGDDRDRPR